MSERRVHLNIGEPSRWLLLSTFRTVRPLKLDYIRIHFKKSVVQQWANGLGVCCIQVGRLGSLSERKHCQCPAEVCWTTVDQWGLCCFLTRAGKYSHEGAWKLKIKWHFRFLHCAKELVQSTGKQKILRSLPHEAPLVSTTHSRFIKAWWESNSNCV